MFSIVQSLFTFAAGACTKPTFFGISTWYKYFDIKPNRVGVCEVQVEFIKAGKLDPTAVTLLGLGVLDMLLRLAGLVAVGFVIYGGIQYVTSQGESDKTKRALNTIINSLVGLGITTIAAATVAFLGARIGAGASTTANGLPAINAGDSQLQTILTIFFGVLSAGSLLVIVLAGFRYATAAGDASAMSRAKNTIIYAAVGLLVSFTAFGIVAFALNNI